ncbi:hypothetical protein AWL63_22895 (plasmid) [Sphingomonas panacis]|uniref:Uncharacterized protein n=1 Tax=Sphingomonas panacis TaxID=1560345 RepID=A0A1B3ZHZ0_9SPHN|nr:hypothetical protein AWL63_22895 [Sphingomonas panacis]
MAKRGCVIVCRKGRQIVRNRFQQVAMPGEFGMVGEQRDQIYLIDHVPSLRWDEAHGGTHA